MENSSILEYVDSYIDNLLTDTMPPKEVDKLEDYRITLTKNIQNILKEFKNPKKVFDLNNASIFQYFPFDALTKEERFQLLDHLIDLKNEEAAIGNKVIYNLKKTTYDLPDSRFDKLLVHQKEPSGLANKEYEYKNINRQLIRTSYLDVKILLQNLQFLSTTVLMQEDYDSIYSLYNLYVDSILQALNYWVIGSPDVSYNKKTTLLSSFENFLDTSIVCIKKDSDFIIKNKKLDTSLPIFITFLKYRNRCGMHHNLFQILLEEQEKESDYFAAIPEKYYVAKKTPIVDQNVKLFLNEGTNRCDHFDEKLAQTREMIHLLATRNGRNASSDDLLDLKVYFREIFISKSKYKTTALTIAKKYTSIPPEPITLTEEYFFNEKISRGYFREQSPIELYNQKNEIQHKIYILFTSLLLSYDLYQITNLSYQLTDVMIKMAFSGIDAVLPSYGIPSIFQ